MTTLLSCRSSKDLIFLKDVANNEINRGLPAEYILKTGDILIIPGSPGHVVFIAGTCENKKGERLFLLSEGFTPAQSIHLLKNPFDENISPWYKLEVNSEKINTARFTFSPVNFRSLD